MPDFGRRLQVAFAASGHTPASFAREAAKRGLPVSRQMIGRWLKLKRATVSGEHLVMCGIITGYSIIWLTFGVGSPSPASLENHRLARLSAVVTLVSM